MVNLLAALLLLQTSAFANSRAAWVASHPAASPSFGAAFQAVLKSPAGDRVMASANPGAGRFAYSSGELHPQALGVLQSRLAPVEADLRTLERADRRRIMDAIEGRLIESPAEYGKPLGGRLAGFRRIRVGDTRVAYRIRGRSVIVWIVERRESVYDELVRRLK